MQVSDLLLKVVQRLFKQQAPDASRQPASLEANPPDFFCISEIIPQIQPLCIIDIGAMAIEGIPAHYARLTDIGLAKVIGFEASTEECAKLNAVADPNHSYFPYAIYDGSDQTLHITDKPESSSLLEPNTAFIEAFYGLPFWLKVVRREPIKTTKLDDIRELRNVVCDYLKLDIQGAELVALRNAEKILKDTLIIHTEVEFAPLYRGQPLFAEIDQYLRAKGFVFHMFVDLCGGTYAPSEKKCSPCLEINQVLWGDAVYIRDFREFDKLPPDRLLKLAAILHEVYRSSDLCYMILDVHDRLTGESLANVYKCRFGEMSNSDMKYFSTNDIATIPE